MKKLSRSERNGAIALAAVALLVVGGAFMMRSCNSVGSVEAESSSGVTILVGDTASHGSTSDNYDGEYRDSHGRHYKNGRGRKRKTSSHGRRRESNRSFNDDGYDAVPVRDLLSDTIPSTDKK